MDNSKNNTARNALQQSSHLEDELWELEDSWDEDDEGATESVPTEEPAKENTPTPKTTPAVDKAPQVNESPEPEIEPEEPVEIKTSKEVASELIQKSNLNGIEKIALSVVAVLFLGIAIWGYAFLKKQNNLGIKDKALNFPIEGKHSTISDLKTFWLGAEGRSGVKLGALVIPATTITLADDCNTSGTLRVYFYNSDQDSVGDPITVNFNSGQFENGEKSIELSASDGFHQEGDYNSYGVDPDLSWRVHVLEASSDDVSSSGFEKLLETSVKPIKK